jgi:hypothetical protein
VAVATFGEEMLPRLREYIPGVAIGATHAIAGMEPCVGDRH